MNLEEAISTCDFAAIATRAGIMPAFTAGDRLAVLQRLLPRISEPDLRDRLEDLANIIARHPYVCEANMPGLITHTRQRLTKRFGPYYASFVSIEPLLLGYLRRMQLQADLPPQNYFSAFCRRCLELTGPEKKCEIHRSQVGRSSHQGNLADCTLCHGGDEQCECAIFIDVPKNAKVGWICGMLDHQQDVLWHVRISEIAP